jgi:hypothetical protein
MPIKENQPETFRCLAEWFVEEQRFRDAERRQASDIRTGHGRLERRTLMATTELNDYLDRWTDIQQALCLSKTVTCLKSGEVSHITRYAITSLPPQQADPLFLLTLWREHWSIENGLHYPRDVFFQEDASHMRLGNAPSVMASFRNALIGLLHAFQYPSLKFACERFAARPFHALGLLELSVSDWLE